jgi:hypothetical protein
MELESPFGVRFAFEEDADEALCATRDYFWALAEGLIDGHTAEAWRAFRAGYTQYAQAETEETTEPPPLHPTRRLRETDQDQGVRSRRRIG